MSTIESADFLEAERPFLKSDREPLIDLRVKISCRYGKPFEKSLREPNQQQSKNILEHNGKMGRAHCKVHVGLYFVGVFFKKLADPCR